MLNQIALQLRSCECASIINMTYNSWGCCAGEIEPTYVRSYTSDSQTRGLRCFIQRPLHFEQKIVQDERLSDEFGRSCRHT
jgi:hypothetical protein